MFTYKCSPYPERKSKGKLGKITLHRGFDLRSANAYKIKVGRNMVIAEYLHSDLLPLP